jgi:hypothetical protein
MKNNNNILMLLIATLAVGVMCAIVAGIAVTYYNGGFDELGGDDTPATLQAVVDENQPSGLDTSAVIESVQESGSSGDVDYISLMNLMQKSQTCSSSLVLVETSMATVQVDPSILENEQNSADIQAFLEEAETNCKGLGDNDDLADTHSDINKVFSKAEKSIDNAIENYQDYFTYKKSKYLEEGNADYEDALEYMANGFEMLQQAMSGDAP